MRFGGGIVSRSESAVVAVVVTLWGAGSAGSELLGFEVLDQCVVRITRWLGAGGYVSHQVQQLLVANDSSRLTIRRIRGLTEGNGVKCRK